MRKIYAIILAAFLTMPLVSNAQLPPDFTITDMDGTTHNLHTYLNNGYTVVLDFWATWCGPCLASTPALDRIHEDRSFPGDDTYVVLSIEFDANTSDEQDIVDAYCIQNPVIIDDNSTIRNDYNYQGSIPYFVVICPDGSWNDRTGGTGDDPTLLTNLASGCTGQKAGPSDDAKLVVEHCAGSTQFLCKGVTSIAPTTTLRNIGTSPLTQAKIEVSMDGNVVETYEWFGNLPKYFEQEINLTSINNINFVAHELELKIIEANGSADPNALNNLSVTQLQPSAQSELTLTLDITTDQYGEETSWEVLNGSGSVVASGPAVEYGDNQSFTETINVTAEDCYTFVMKDAFGDGMCCSFGNGSYTLSDANGVIASGGSYGLEELSGFHTKTTATGIEEYSFLASMDVFPNPADQFVNLIFNLNNTVDAEIQVINPIGQIVKSVETTNYVQGNNEVTISTEDLASGVYFISMKTSGNAVTQKFVVNR